MSKNKILLSLFFVLAFMVFLVPQSYATYEYNGVTLPDLPKTLPEAISSIDVKSFDYIIFDRDSTDNFYNLTIFYYVDDTVDTKFYLYGDTKPNRFYLDPNGYSYVYVDYVYKPGEYEDWHLSANDTKLQNELRYFDFGSNRNLYYSSFDIYTDSSLETIFFQKTPSTIPLYQIVGEMVKEETPKMATKVLQAMKVIVVFSISCLAFLILLPVFSKVFSTFQVK